MRYLLLILLLGGCAGFERGCSSNIAKTFGAAWLVVQYRMDGAPINCWRLRDASITNEPSSDGIYWMSGDGHLVHISGWYNRVQVSGGDFQGAAVELGIDLAKCTVGAYGVDKFE